MLFDYGVEGIVEKALEIYMRKNVKVDEIHLNQDFVRIYSGQEEKVRIGVRNSDYTQLFSNLMKLVNLYNFKFSFSYEEEDKELFKSIVSEFNFNNKCNLDYACKN